MSYIRFNHPLTWFKGNSHSYVFLSSEGIVDYGDEYEDNATLIEIIGTIIARETGDNEFAEKIVRLLALRLGIADQLRDNQLTDREYLERLMEKCKEFTRGT